MPKVRKTVSLDEEVLRWIRVRGARQGKGDSQVIEESLRRDLGLDLLEQPWIRTVWAGMTPFGSPSKLSTERGRAAGSD